MFLFSWRLSPTLKLGGWTIIRISSENLKIDTFHSLPLEGQIRIFLVWWIRILNCIWGFQIHPKMPQMKTLGFLSLRYGCFRSWGDEWNGVFYETKRHDKSQWKLLNLSNNVRPHHNSYFLYFWTSCKITSDWYFRCLWSRRKQTLGLGY